MAADYIQTTTQADGQTKGCSFQTDSGAPLLRITPLQLIKHGEVEMIPTWRHHPYIWYSLIPE